MSQCNIKHILPPNPYYSTMTTFNTTIPFPHDVPHDSSHTRVPLDNYDVPHDTPHDTLPMWKKPTHPWRNPTGSDLDWSVSKTSLLDDWYSVRTDDLFRFLNIGVQWPSGSRLLRDSLISIQRRVYVYLSSRLLWTEVKIGNSSRTVLKIQTNSNFRNSLLNWDIQDSIHSLDDPWVIRVIP